MAAWKEMAICPECGAANPAGGELCVRCGVALKDALLREKESRARRTAGATGKRPRSTSAKVGTLRIGHNAYPLTDASIHLRFYGEGEERFLTFDISAEAGSTGRTAVAINCMNIAGKEKVSDIQHVRFVLRPEEQDPYNELEESVICQQGETLELTALQLTFGMIQSNRIPIQMSATCSRVDDGGSIDAQAEFTATVSTD